MSSSDLITLQEKQYLRFFYIHIYIYITHIIYPSTPTDNSISPLTIQLILKTTIETTDPFLYSTEQ